MNAFANPTDFDLENSKLVFPVATRDLQILGKSGEVIPVETHKAVVRMVDDKPHQLGIVGADYGVLPHKRFFQTIEDTINDTIRPDLRREVKVIDAASFDGAWGRREYLFPAFAETLNISDKFNSKLGYRIIAWNSYDGSSSAGMLTGLIDFYCTNGMITGSLIGKKMRRHTSGLNPALFRETLTEAVAHVQQEVRQIEAMAATALDLATAENVLKASFSERRTEQLMAQVQEEIAVRGQNVFALHSALTFFASHNSERFAVRNTGNDNVSKTLHQRELDVAKVVAGQAFQHLLAA
jgi:hypothetical protein